MMNKKIILTAMVAVATLAAVAPAQAQRRGGGASLTLFTGVDYREQSVVITNDIADLRTINFDEAAGSLIARGEWQVCLDANYSSRCRIYSDEVPNLESFRGRISSVRYMGDGRNNGGGYGGGGYGGGNGGGWGNNGGGWGNNTPPRYNGQATRGQSTVFYPGSINSDGGYGRNNVSADDFCRAQGNRSAVYSGQDRNGNLEDVLCRR